LRTVRRDRCFFDRNMTKGLRGGAESPLYVLF
jgi:hypothetical protein